MHKTCLSTDRDYLTGRAYANQEPLAVRIQTHERYTVPSVDFIPWVVGLIPWEGDERVLDAGCGNGQYMAPVTERLSERGRYLAGDLSPGMLRELPESVPAVNLDLAALPLGRDTCDVILANHMLYHVPDIDGAVQECHRTLRQGGRLLAATNSQATMAELAVLIQAGCERLGVSEVAAPQRVSARFSLENGQATLAKRFDRVERHVLHSALVFDKPEPLLAYVNSMRDFHEANLPEDVDWEELLQVWHSMIADHIARHGAFRVGKVSGAFVAFK